jgi:hypothetical protein
VNPAVFLGIAAVVLLILWAVVGGGKRDKAVSKAKRDAAAFKARAATDPDWALTETARTFGLALDLAADTVTAAEQATGRFSGSTVAVETLGDVDRSQTLRNVVYFGAAGLLVPKKDGREIYLTVTGDGFQIAARADGDRGDDARRFAATYNTRSGALRSRS